LGEHKKSACRVATAGAFILIAAPALRARATASNACYLSPDFS
jgi:hypothetical protein